MGRFTVRKWGLVALKIIIAFFCTQHHKKMIPVIVNYLQRAHCEPNDKWNVSTESFYMDVTVAITILQSAWLLVRLLHIQNALCIGRSNVERVTSKIRNNIGHAQYPDYGHSNCFLIPRGCARCIVFLCEACGKWVCYRNILESWIEIRYAYWLLIYTCDLSISQHGEPQMHSNAIVALVSIPKK